MLALIRYFLYPTPLKFCPHRVFSKKLTLFILFLISLCAQMPKTRVTVELERLQRQLSDQTHPSLIQGVKLPDGTIDRWHVFILGPPETPYSGGRWTLDVRFPTEYPFKPPNVRVVERIFHPNISQKGTICLDILQKEWTPAMTIDKLALSIVSLLSSPNVYDPMNLEAANLYLTDQLQNTTHYSDKVRQWARVYACAPPSQTREE